jgi:hypothetical protein
VLRGHVLVFTSVARRRQQQKHPSRHSPSSNASKISSSFAKSGDVGSRLLRPRASEGGAWAEPSTGDVSAADVEPPCPELDSPGTSRTTPLSELLWLTEDDMLVVARTVHGTSSKRQLENHYTPKILPALRGILVKGQNDRVTVFAKYPPITYYWTVSLILDRSYLVGKLTSSKIADRKV